MRRLPAIVKDLSVDPSPQQQQQQQQRHRSTKQRRGISLCNPNVAIRLVLFVTLYAVANTLLLWLPSSDTIPPAIRGEMMMHPHETEMGIQVLEQPSLTARIRKPIIPSFPVVISKSDMEVIPHPAVIYGADLPKNVSQTLVVPKFWKPPVKLSGGLMSKETAKSIGSFWQEEEDQEQHHHETIFVSIATYRDPDCINTIKSIYSRASIPQRIRTVVVEQLKDGEDSRCTQPPIPCEEDPQQILCQYSHLIESYEFDARLAVGPTFARHIAHRHYRGEYFVLQVDSHVRFTQNFDEDLIHQWQSANNEMAVLSTYLLDLNGAIDKETHESTKTARALMCNAYFEGSIIKNGQQAARPVAIKGTPTIHPFWAAGFSFARGHFLTQVPYDGYLPMIFQGEEISMTIRAFTFGYDFYAPERNVCFHMYALNKNRPKRLAVPLFSENRKPFKGLEEQAMKRLTSIIQLNHHHAAVPPTTSDTDDGEEQQQHQKPPAVVADYIRIEEDLYGLGQVRSPQTFYKTFGIHTESQTMENHLCWFVGENMQRRFLPHLRKDGMGIDYETLNYNFEDPAPNQP